MSELLSPLAANSPLGQAAEGQVISRRLGHMLGGAGYGMAILIGYIAWISGGSVSLNHFTWILIAATTIGLLIRELVQFLHVFGLSKIIFYCGVLIWFCHDYFYTYIIVGTGNSRVPVEVISRSTFYHALFVGVAGMVVQTKGIRWMTRAACLLSEPKSYRAYLPVLFVATFLGLVPIMLYSREDNFLSAIYYAIVSGRGGLGKGMSIGRGNLNYSWYSYILRLNDVGVAGAIFGAYYFFFLTRSSFHRLICAANWIFWAAMSFGSGTRGMLVMIIVPTAAFAYLRYQSEAAWVQWRQSKRAYLYSAAVLLIGFCIIQVQITFRNVGYTDIKFDKVSFLEPQGNQMFTEGLLGFQRIPRDHPYFYDNIPGETVVAPVFIESFFFVIHPIPRALWNNKPYDPVWAWYNGEGTGRSVHELEGTTLATGLVGYWYIRYGFFGVLEGAILFGLLLASIESAFRVSGLRPLTVFLCCGMQMTLFRFFRAVSQAEAFVMIVGIVGLWLLLKFLSVLMGGNNYQPEESPVASQAQ